MTDDRCELLCLDLQVAERLRKKRLAPGEADVGAGKARAWGTDLSAEYVRINAEYTT